MLKKIKFYLPVALLVSMLLLSLSACASTPKEKTDELDGTDWTWHITEQSYRRFRFRAGKYSFATSRATRSDNIEEEGTYVIDGDKIILTKNPKGLKFTYVLSEDRQKFWPENEVGGRFYYARGKTLSESLDSIFKKKK
jgi:hypothetical protein